MAELDDIILELQAILDKLDEMNELAASVHVAQAIEILSKARDRSPADQGKKD